MYLGKKWEVDDICEITNPSSGTTTCFGQAVTYGRRCRRVVVSARQVSALLEGLTTLSPWEAARSDRLRQAATMSVCWQHGGQVDGIAWRWKQALQDLGCRPALNAHSPRSAASKVKVEDEWESGYISSKPGKPQQLQFHQDDVEAIMKEMERLRETLKRLQKEKTEHASRFSQQGAEEKQRQEEEEEDERARRRKEKEERRRLREERERKEREQRERERREREERERKEKEEAERKKRQREAEERQRQEEKLRRSARRRAQEREEAAKQEWVAAWKLYCRRWDAIAQIDPSKIKRNEIPWPVKTAKWDDVSEANIKEFYRKAPLLAKEATTGEEIYKLMGQESKRWHTDKIMHHFGRRILVGPYGNALNTIAKVVVDLRKEAQSNRRE